MADALRESTAGASPMLAVANLNAWYGKAQILYDVSFDVRPGECVALMGRNGAGKSTTMKALMGVLAKRSGQVTFRAADVAHDISTLAPYRINRLGLGWVPEDRRVFTDLTVMENLAVAQQPPRKGAPTWSHAQLFELFPNLGAMPERHGGSMSGGEQQMLTIARTLMGNPYLILLDEPSEGVAPVIVEQMAQMILTLKRQGLAILLSEQNLHFARLVSDRAVVLEKGQVQFDDSMAVLMRDEAIQRNYLSV
ncbi:ABC transporter ATP-binding protein [soil metagenome]